MILMRFGHFQKWARTISDVEEHVFRAGCGSDPFYNLTFARPRRYIHRPHQQRKLGGRCDCFKMTLCVAELMASDFNLCLRAVRLQWEQSRGGSGWRWGQGGSVFFNQPPPLRDRSCHIHSVVMEALLVLGPGTPQRRAMSKRKTGSLSNV